MDKINNIDKKDQKILTELILNSRIPINRLAKKIGLSREVVNYRLNKLIKEKIILECYTIINTELLNFERFGCFIQLKNITQEKEKDFMNFLIKYDFVTYVGPVIGKWNVAFDILARDKRHLEEIIKEIINYTPNKIESYIITSVAEQETFPTKLMGTSKEIKVNVSTEKAKLDEKDLKILKLISSNSRIEYKEISEKLKLTANAIKYRIKNLENAGIIQCYTISIDIRKFGCEWHNIQVKLSGNKEPQLKNFLRLNPKVVYFYKHLGNENWDLDIGIIAKNSLEVREFLLDLREKFGDIIKIHDIYISTEEIKGNYAPAGLFKKNLNF